MAFFMTDGLLHSDVNKYIKVFQALKFLLRQQNVAAAAVGVDELVDELMLKVINLLNYSFL